MHTHPAYPAPADVRRYAAAHRLADREYANNKRIHAILSRTLAELNACDLHGYSLIAGYDLHNVYDQIADMMPRLDDNDAGEKLNAWAADRAAEGE